ncbi:HTH-type transcriptional activator RhaR [Shimwellia pseudoproteus]|uniref:HTH-type transcriptional activator RhaR n=1 Tax=Shimwellia pseudoproteus TaxID=570012 RepID=UPI0018EC8769|nr:HTH-type transcriptional activator RhaR [Shimwellia pseudoproteus]MBJ3814339.1 HTH-type transcriptional activator RhaR [Shimwellia pseudoproteus]
MTPLILHKADFFPNAAFPVAVAGRYPQDVFVEHSHDFNELVMVLRGNGLHVLNGRPWRITRGDLFYIRAADKHSYTSVNNLVLQNIMYCPGMLTLSADWGRLLPGLDNRAYRPDWRLTGRGMAEARALITQLEQETSSAGEWGSVMIESLFLQLTIALYRHRYIPAQAPEPEERGSIEALIAALATSLDSGFDLAQFCAHHHCTERALRQQFRQQTGMNIPGYLRQLRICHAQYLLQHSGLLISDIATRCGFEDSNYFSVVFTRETGITPRQWRQNHSTGLPAGLSAAP